MDSFLLLQLLYQEFVLGTLMHRGDSLDRHSGDRIACPGSGVVNERQQQRIPLRRGEALQFPSIGRSSLLRKFANQGWSDTLQLTALAPERLQPLQMIDALLQVFARRPLRQPLDRLKCLSPLIAGTRARKASRAPERGRVP